MKTMIVRYVICDPRAYHPKISMMIMARASITTAVKCSLINMVCGCAFVRNQIHSDGCDSHLVSKIHEADLRSCGGLRR